MNPTTLRDRLRLLRPGAAPATASARPLSTAPVPRLPLSRRPPDPVPGTTVATSAGPAFCIEQHFPLHYRRGLLPLTAATRVPAASWDRWLGRPTDGAFAPESAVFVDVETTGLERGTGTYAFLIGVGRFVDGGFRVRQFFMRDYDEEPAVLEAVLQELEGARGLFTFNGLSFDWPLLQARATINRLSLPEPVQLDLLYPARRLWRPVTGDCRLSRLERDILGVTRRDDVPGYLIPQLYFRYLETGDTGPLPGIIEHNRQDILTTAALAVYVGSVAAEPLRAAPLGRPLPGSDLYAVGRLFTERREWAEAAACLEEAMRRGLPEVLRRDCRRLLAACYRQLGRDEDAAAQWRMLAEGGGLTVEPYVELAKYYEHRAKDLAAARQWTLRAIEVVQRRRALRPGIRGVGRTRPAAADRDLDELTHRLGRLERKLARRSLSLP